MPESKYDSYRFLLVAFEEKDRTNSINRARRSNMAKIRKTLHELSREHDIKLADFGTNFDIVTREEQATIERIFKNVMQRAKARQEQVIEMQLKAPLYKGDLNGEERNT